MVGYARRHGPRHIPLAASDVLGPGTGYRARVTATYLQCPLPAIAVAVPLTFYSS